MAWCLSTVIAMVRKTWRQKKDLFKAGWTLDTHPIPNQSMTKAHRASEEDMWSNMKPGEYWKVPRPLKPNIISTRSYLVSQGPHWGSQSPILTWFWRANLIVISTEKCSIPHPLCIPLILLAPQCYICLWRRFLEMLVKCELHCKAKLKEYFLNMEWSFIFFSGSAWSGYCTKYICFESYDQDLEVRTVPDF